MSEFSESYHLKSERTEDAVQLLRKVKLKGYVYPSINGWVTFLPQDGDFTLNQKIVSATQLPLLHYVYAEDHGWGFTLVNNSKIICLYQCDWNDEIVVNDQGYSRDSLLAIAPEPNQSLLNEFEKTMHPTEFEELFENESAKQFAQLMNLEHYDWLSFDGIDGDIQENADNHPDVIKVE